MVKKRYRYSERNLAIKGFLFLLPFLSLFIVFTILPVIVSIGYSFTYFNLIEKPIFIGLKNYVNLLTADSIFLIALKNTLVFAVIVGPLGYLMSFFFAWVINQLRCRSVFALAFYIPSITSGVALSTVWLYFFSNDRYGLVNQVLFKLGLITEPIYWVSDPNHILQVVIIISLWMSMGTGFLVFLAGLQNVSAELSEAGAIDGIRNKFQELIYIILPTMKPQLLFGAITTIANSFGVFDIAVTVAGMPSPQYAAYTIVGHLFDQAFIQFKMGYASAVAVILFLLTFCLGQLVMRLLSSKED